MAVAVIDSNILIDYNDTTPDSRTNGPNRSCMRSIGAPVRHSSARSLTDAALYSASSSVSPSLAATSRAKCDRDRRNSPSGRIGRTRQQWGCSRLGPNRRGIGFLEWHQAWPRLLL